MLVNIHTLLLILTEISYGDERASDSHASDWGQGT